MTSLFRRGAAASGVLLLAACASTPEIPFERTHEADSFWLPKVFERKKFRIRIWFEEPGKGYIRHQFLDYTS